MAIVPKGARKRASKKSAKAAKAETTTEVETTTEEVVVKATKKSASIPVPMFQAAPEDVAPKKTKAAPAKSETANSSSTSDVENESDEASAERRRRRRGGRGRRRGRDTENETTDSADSSEELDAGAISDDESESSTTSSPRRRRRRRATGDGVTPGETIEEDGVITVVKVREPRAPGSSTRPERSSRSDGRRGDRRDRGDRGNRRNDREPRDFVRRRGTIITESEFLARRENVNREMLVRQTGDRTQIAVLEDNIMVEHYVNRNSNISYVGNVYLGKVQNVLPSMEAAFVDIGKGRNAVLYAGEVNWDTAGLADGAPRKIEHVLKTGQSVLVQVTKDPIGQKGARLTSQISLPGRYLVYVPR